ncbi:MAG: IPExxxVDY family protein [Bacteroidota bacterium]
MAKKILIDTRSEAALYTLIGISCHLRDYHLTYLLNEKLELEFIKEEDFRGFPLFFCRDENGFNTYNLLGNRGAESFLLPEMKQADYLLLVEGPFNKTRTERLLKNIRKIGKILLSFEINIESVKNFETVLSDLEIHFMHIHKESKTKYSPSKK